MEKSAAPLALALLASSAACGREDSIWGGLSGVILFIVIVWAAIHFIRK